MISSKFFDPTRTEDNFKIKINRHGQWFHDNGVIARDTLVKLFSTALHYNSTTNEYWLITPHEQGRIVVEDTPFVIVDFKFHGTDLTLVTNLGDIITPDENAPITCNDDGVPYAIGKNNVPARLNRMVRDKLIDIAIAQNGYHNDTKTLLLNANDHDHIIACS
jgi:hypothetical protein